MYFAATAFFYVVFVVVVVVVVVLLLLVAVFRSCISNGVGSFFLIVPVEHGGVQPHDALSRYDLRMILHSFVRLSISGLYTALTENKKNIINRN